ncbi:MAG: decarboxylase [Clostridiaceae bacterium]|nr:decarboxylase [Clostridiaceae bacterium]
MSELPLIEGIMNYVRENNIPFSMPGHKSGRGFNYTKQGRELINNFLKYDITEVDGVDNLHKPDGIIKESLDLLSKYYGSKKSYYLVNGSTSGNLAMIFSCFDEGDKVIVERNCHRSVFNGIIMRKLHPIYIDNEIYEEYNAPLSINMEHFLNTIKCNKDAKGIIITYPSYYGVCCDLKYIISIAKQYGMKVLVDSAHGAHFGACDELPDSAIKLGADVVVVSAHKTLPSLTQTAYLHIGKSMDESTVDFYVSLFLSTSPSYLFMCSLEYSRFFLEKYGNEEYKKLINLTQEYKNKINNLGTFHIISNEDIKRNSYNEKIDPTRYIVNLNNESTGHEFLNYLRKSGIQGEMSDESNVILIFSPFNTREDFEKLYEAMRNFKINHRNCTKVKIKKVPIPEMRYLPYETLTMNKTDINIDNSIGRISCDNIVPYPPGIPIVMMGEIIDKDSINMIKYYMKQNISVLGMHGEYIRVIKET